ncbi:MAG: hypothetical protein RBG13Loki_3549 [Promethearchaeota archaeon CR_4]|nr:MAG: hypothetical protein RBG13Loki_3549 [Candidatus Lokiarchaeota archaeon CR_4]
MKKDREIEIPENLLNISEEEKRNGTIIFRRKTADRKSPINHNPGCFWIGWLRLRNNDDFRQLCRHKLCWHFAYIDKNETSGYGG